MSFKRLLSRAVLTAVVGSVTSPALGATRNDGLKISGHTWLVVGVTEIMASLPVTQRLSLGLTFGAGEPMGDPISYHAPTTAVWELGVRADHFISAPRIRNGWVIAYGLKYSNYQIRASEGDKSPSGFVYVPANSAGSGSWLIAEIFPYYQMRIARFLTLGFGAIGKIPLLENYGYDQYGHGELRNSQRTFLPAIELSWVF